VIRTLYFVCSQFDIRTSFADRVLSSFSSIVDSADDVFGDSAEVSGLHVFLQGISID